MTKRVAAVCERIKSVRYGGSPLRMFIGLDGFVDEIIHVVSKRYDTGSFDRFGNIAEFGEKIKQAGGLSCNFELVSVSERLGGNGPIFANALLSLGASVTYCGALGYPDIHPVFKPMANRPNCKVISAWQPAHTDALEFGDGKLLLGKLTPLDGITWEAFKPAMGGLEGIVAALEGVSLFGMENWTMIPYMSDIWEGIINEALPMIKAGDVKPVAFFDLADPAKRTKEDILRALKLLGGFGSHFRVILGLNEKEAREIASVLDISKAGLNLAGLTRAIFDKLDVYCLAVHPVREACAVTEEGYFRVEGPYCENPVLTTGAGDNFNAGFCFGQVLGLDAEESLMLGVCASGYYVRNAKSAGTEELVEFLEKYDGGLY